MYVAGARDDNAEERYNGTGQMEGVGQPEK